MSIFASLLIVAVLLSSTPVVALAAPTLAPESPQAQVVDNSFLSHLASLFGLDKAVVFGTNAQVQMVAGTSTVPTNVQEVIDEVMRPNNDPIGRPLPVASHWQNGAIDYYTSSEPRNTATFVNPIFQVNLLNAGHHWLPVVHFPGNMPVETTVPYKMNFHTYFSGAWDTFAAWGIPFTMLGTQWESSLTYRPEFRDLPPAQNPNVIGTDGVIKDMVDPQGPLAPWYDAGKLWTTEKTGWADIVARYPSPPKIILLSNNEHAKLNETNADTSKRWVDAHGIGTSAVYRREMFAKGWKDRYSELFRGMRDGLAQTAPGWLPNSKLIGYGVNGLGHYGRWGGWTQYSSYYPNHLDSGHTYWDGGSPSYYLNDWEAATDFGVWSPQTQAMNEVFMNEIAHKENPDYWYEMSVWDGRQRDPDPAKNKRAWYESIGDSFTPERYGAWIRYGMWLTKPRVVREFRGWVETQEEIGPQYLEELLGAVDEIYDQELLKRFWRKGQLVVNDKRKHPYQAEIPPEYAHIERWYNLDTELDSEGVWSLGTQIPVWAIAHVLGEAPNREWLIYAYSPKQDRTNVRIKIPGYCTVVMDVPQNGTFLHVQESSCADDTFGGSGLRLHFTFSNVGTDPKRTFTDVSGNGFYGEWVGSSAGSHIQGKFDNAVKFNKAGDRVIIRRDIRQSFDLADTLVGGGSISFWIRMDKPQVGGTEVFGNPYSDGFYLYFAGGTKLRMQLKINGVAEQNEGPTIPTDGQWHHVAHVLNSDRTHSYYLDGALKGTVGPISAFPQATGDRVWNTTASMGDYLEAGLDDFRIYDRPLSVVEVQALYQGTVQNPPRDYR